MVRPMNQARSPPRLVAQSTPSGAGRATRLQNTRGRGTKDQNLLKKIDSGKAIIGVVGLGYVGLPTSVLFAKKFRVVGYDVDRRLIRELPHGVTRIEDVPRSALVACLGNSFFPTTKEKDLDGCDV